jgi:hypothetical protein
LYSAFLASVPVVDIDIDNRDQSVNCAVNGALKNTEVLIVLAVKICALPVRVLRSNNLK